MITLTKNRENTFTINLKDVKTLPNPYYIFDWINIYNYEFIFSIQDTAPVLAPFSTFKYVDGSSFTLGANGVVHIWESSVDASVIDPSSMHFLKTFQYKLNPLVNDIEVVDIITGESNYALNPLLYGGESGTYSSMTTKPYVDGSLAQRDASILWLQNNSVTSSYVDGSLAQRDVSILNLQNWNVSQDGSIVDLKTINGYQDISIGILNNWDVSQDVSIANIQTHNISQDASIVALQNKDIELDASIVLLTSWQLSQDSSIELLRNKNVEQDASIVVLQGKDIDIDASLVLIQNHNISQDTSIVDLRNKNIDQDASILNLQNYVLDISTNSSYWKPYVDGSLSVKADKVYVDGSLAERDSSITWLNTNKQPLGAYIRDTSNGNGLYWNAGMLDVSVISEVTLSYVDGSLAERDASLLWIQQHMTPSSLTQDYVDGSFGFRDVSIEWLQNNKQPLGAYIRDTSNGNGLFWNAGMLDVSVISEVTLSYVDGSLLSRDNSIAYLTNENISQDASIVILKGKDLDLDASINELRGKNLDIDASLVLIQNHNISQDASIILKAEISYVDGSLLLRDNSIAYLTNENISQDASIVILRGKDTDIDASLVLIQNKNISQDASIDELRTGTSSWKNYVDGSLSSRDTSIAWLNTNKQPIGNYLRDSSLGTTLYWNGNVFDVSQGAVGITKTYVDGSLALRDISINYLNIQRAQHDASIIRIDASLADTINFDGLFLKESSIGSSFKWTAGYLDLSTNFVTKTNIDASFGLYYTKTQVDASFYTKTQVDASFYTKTQVDASFYTKTQVDASFYTKSQVDASFYTKTHVDASFGLITNLAKSPFNVLSLANAGDSSIAWYIRNGWNAKYILTKDVSLMIPDVSHGDSGTLLLIEDASGTWKMNLPSNSFILNDASTITKTANAKNFLTFVYDISTFYWNLGKNYITQTQV